MHPSSDRHTPAQRFLLSLLLAIALLLAMGAAYGVTTGNLVIAAATVALVGGMVLSAFPMAVLWVLIATSLVVAGLAKLYLPAIQEIRWAAVPLALLLAGYALLVRLSEKDEDQRGMPPLLWWAGGVVVTILVTTLVNSPDPMQLVRGLKGYFQVWGLMVGLALLRWPEPMMRRGLPLFLLAVALMQLPFVAHQYLILVPQRAMLAAKGVVPEDVIGGTFGAQLEGGGSNSMLAAYMFVVLGGLGALWQRAQLSGRRLVVLGSVLLMPLFLNEAKVSLVYLMVLFAVLFGHDLLARPARFIAASVAAALLLFALLTAYAMAIRNPNVHGVADLVREAYAANVTSDYENRGSFTRAGALRYWARQHIPRDPFGALAGHGAYESRSGEEGAAALWDSTDPALGLKNTAISAILWDAGLLGLASVFILMGSAYATAGRLARRYRDDPWLAGLFTGARAAAALFFVSLWFKSYFSYHLAYQTVFALLVGWLAYWELRSARSRNQSSIHPPAHSPTESAPTGRCQ